MQHPEDAGIGTSDCPCLICSATRFIDASMKAYNERINEMCEGKISAEDCMVAYALPVDGVLKAHPQLVEAIRQKIRKDTASIEAQGRIVNQDYVRGFAAGKLQGMFIVAVAQARLCAKGVPLNMPCLDRLIRKATEGDGDGNVNHGVHSQSSRGNIVGADGRRVSDN